MIHLDTTWYRLPYADKDDPSIAFTDAVWRFADKELHVQGKWGSKGHTQKPRFERIGFTHSSYGSWYEGSTPYKHSLYFHISENTNATIENALKAGYKVAE